jgi:hypothetical protein
MLFLQYDLPFVTFLVVRCMAFSIFNTCNVFVTVTSSIGSTVMLYDWMIFCIKITSRLFMANKDCMTVVLTVHTLISRLRFFKVYS